MPVYLCMSERVASITCHMTLSGGSVLFSSQQSVSYVGSYCRFLWDREENALPAIIWLYAVCAGGTVYYVVLFYLILHFFFSWHI